VKERRNKHGQLMCACEHSCHEKSCVNEATMSMALGGTRYESGRCTPCEIGRFCRG